MSGLRKRTRSPSDRCRTHTRGFHVTRPAHNTCAVKDAANGTLSAQYEYGPFVEVIRMTGAMARFNPIRWSTKYQDDEIDLVYCGYPFYSPSMSRWLSRDPIREKGEPNLYSLAGK